MILTAISGGATALGLMACGVNALRLWLLSMSLRSTASDISTSVRFVGSAREEARSEEDASRFRSLVQLRERLIARERSLESAKRRWRVLLALLSLATLVCAFLEFVAPIP